MKEWVVHNKTVPIEVLYILSQDEDANVRYTVAQKRKLTDEIFQRLATDTDESVRLAIACNPKTPIGILRQMVQDEWDEIKEVAKRRLDETGR